MSTTFSAHTIFGMKMIHLTDYKTLAKVTTKYNEDTGEPYPHETETTTLTFLGQEYEDDEALISELFDIGKGPFAWLDAVRPHYDCEYDEIIVGRELGEAIATYGHEPMSALMPDTVDQALKSIREELTVRYEATGGKQPLSFALYTMISAC